MRFDTRQLPGILDEPRLLVAYAVVDYTVGVDSGHSSYQAPGHCETTVVERGSRQTCPASGRRSLISDVVPGRCVWGLVGRVSAIDPDRVVNTA